MFQVLCVGLVALIIGLIVCFSGYRFFLVLLPFWGFFAGFGIGASAVTWLFGDLFLATITGWIVGFVVGLVFAVLSYLFYIVGVALLAGSLGYALGSGLMLAILPNASFVVALVGLVGAVIVAVIVLALNIQKLVIVFLTAFGGAGATIAGVMLMFNKMTLDHISGQNVANLISDSWFWLLVFIGLGVLGFLGQMQTTQAYELEPPPNRI
ncbi:DUF4203 domain-containing protein [Chloroflexota bacterium]